TASVLVTDSRAAALARVAVEDEIAAMDLACSRFRQDSELAQVNRATGTPVPVSVLFLEALGVALRAARVTAGLVDPTIGSAMRVLGYVRDFASLAADDSACPSVRVSMQRVPGWQLVRMDRTLRTVVTPPGVEL